MGNIEQGYKRRREAYDRLQQRQVKAIGLISNLRLIVFLVGMASAIILYITKNYYLFTAAILTALIIFILLVIKHGKLHKNKVYSALLHSINNHSIKRLKGEWEDFEDEGKDFIDENHSYSQDLDIFGKSSLYQWICAAKTHYGRLKLMEMLTIRPQQIDDIYTRQEAVLELAPKLWWRQRFLAEGLLVSDKKYNPENLIQWANGKNEFFHNPSVIIFLRVVPVITGLLVLISVVTHIVPYYIPVLALLFQYILLSIKRKERYQVFSTAGNYKDDIKVYYKMLKFIEKQPFQSEYLKKVKGSMCSEKGLMASRQIDKLSRIIDSTANRYNAYYHVFNILTLWDYQNMIILEKWKAKSGPLMKKWLEAIGTVEALSSLSIIRYDQRDWVMPEILAGTDNIFEAKDIGHPLLTGRKVKNDVLFQPPTRVLLITGSNMSGKSTLLRTAGINLVLAYAGAPVCAKAFRATLMDIHTCMRVSDNLGKSISSFYAELLRIKTIVTEANAGKKVFLLLDEIFKGTNSIDRHTGARALIQKLSKTNSIGFVSTHDLELSNLEEENSKIKNYHFREYYRDDEIYFDYKLCRGPSTTRNARYLMRMAGIDINDQEV